MDIPSTSNAFPLVSTASNQDLIQSQRCCAIHRVFSPQMIPSVTRLIIDQEALSLNQASRRLSNQLNTYINTKGIERQSDGSSDPHTVLLYLSKDYDACPTFTRQGSIDSKSHQCSYSGEMFTDLEGRTSQNKILVKNLKRSSDEVTFEQDNKGKKVKLLSTDKVSNILLEQNRLPVTDCSVELRNISPVSYSTEPFIDDFSSLPSAEDIEEFNLALNKAKEDSFSHLNNEDIVTVEALDNIAKIEYLLENENILEKKYCLSELPILVFTKITDYLSCKDLFNLSCSSKNNHELVNRTFTREMRLFNELPIKIRNQYLELSTSRPEYILNYLKDWGSPDVEMLSNISNKRREFFSALAYSRHLKISHRISSLRIEKVLHVNHLVTDYAYLSKLLPDGTTLLVYNNNTISIYDVNDEGSWNNTYSVDFSKVNKIYTPNSKCIYLIDNANLRVCLIEKVGITWEKKWIKTFNTEINISNDASDSSDFDNDAVIERSKMLILNNYFIGEKCNTFIIRMICNLVLHCIDDLGNVVRQYNINTSISDTNLDNSCIAVVNTHNEICIYNQDENRFWKKVFKQQDDLNCKRLRFSPTGKSLIVKGVFQNKGQLKVYSQDINGNWGKSLELTVETEHDVILTEKFSPDGKVFTLHERHSFNEITTIIYKYVDNNWIEFKKIEFKKIESVAFMKVHFSHNSDYVFVINSKGITIQSLIDKGKVIVIPTLHKDIIIRDIDINIRGTSFCITTHRSGKFGTVIHIFNLGDNGMWNNVKSLTYPHSTCEAKFSPSGKYLLIKSRCLQYFYERYKVEFFGKNDTGNWDCLETVTYPNDRTKFSFDEQHILIHTNKDVTLYKVRPIFTSTDS